MAENTGFHPITIDLNEFKLHIELKNRIELTLHFNSPSRRFYLSVIAFVVNEMKRQGKITFIPMKGHHALLALLNETIGGSAGSSEEESLLSRIYRKWQRALPNLEEAPLFMVLGRRKGYEEGSGKAYTLTEAEKDIWANLFEYKGSHENVRLKFAVDRIGVTLDDVVILYEDCLNADAWEKFISSLKEKVGERQEVEPDQPVSEEPEVSTPPVERRKTLLSGRYRWVALAGAIVVVLGAITFAIWRTHPKPDPNDVASIEKMAFPLPDKPSIAVLPFTNMSGDPKQEFLSDGMTEEIITALAKVPRLFVIARTSTDTYKGKPVKVKQVSEELGVQYVLEGGLQRSGDRLRITAQLIDALTGNHLWAGLYDGELKDLFALQDEIIMKILMGVQAKLEREGGGFVSLRNEKTVEKYYRGKFGLSCYLKLMEGRNHYLRETDEDINLARQMIEDAIAMCPENPAGYAYLGYVYLRYLWVDDTESRQKTLEKVNELAQKALAMDDSTANAHALLGWVYIIKGQYEKGIAEGKRGVDLDPGEPALLAIYAHYLSLAGRPEEAIPLLQNAIRLSPVGPAYVYTYLGTALRNAGRYEEAVSAFKKAIQLATGSISPQIGLVATYSLMGREKEARDEAAEVLRIYPKFSVDSFATRIPYSAYNLYKDQSEMDKYINALRKAGLK